ncbi:MAG: hypothetical protein AVDCRST_MAG66-2963, partial [uncultured Pseudonocardia sp.]
WPSRRRSPSSTTSTDRRAPNRWSSRSRAAATRSICHPGMRVGCARRSPPTFPRPGAPEPPGARPPPHPPRAAARTGNATRPSGNGRARTDSRSPSGVASRPTSSRPSTRPT